MAADPQLEALQRQAGSGLGQKLALPQIAAVAELARKLRIPVSRPALAASAVATAASNLLRSRTPICGIGSPPCSDLST